jgi:16S rRNA (cytosine967-C5)-methyltransferase
LLKDAWALAIETMSWMQMRKLSERIALARTVKQLGISDYSSVRLAHRLVCETVRRQNFIDAFINKAVKPETIGEYNLGVQAFLRLYVYQTRVAHDWEELDVEEAESVAKLGRSILGWKTLRRVESALGLLLMQKQVANFEGRSDEERIGLATFHPTWFVKYCFKLFGRTETINMLEADVQPAFTYIRLNTLKAGEDQILERLNQEQIKLEKVKQLKNTYRLLMARHPLTQMVSFQQGLFHIQDKASCLLTEVADPQPETTVLDVCAAPGANTTYLAQLMKDTGIIYSVDYSNRRMATWKKEIARMGVENAEPIIADARISLPLKTEADLVILDPPCTSTGTFRKSISDKWRLTPNSIDRMAAIQWQMINTCCQNVKPQGTLIYSTCSLTVEENEMIIERFLKWHTEFTLVKITSDMALPGLRELDKCRRLYPHIHGCNGCFIAKLLRKA